MVMNGMTRAGVSLALLAGGVGDGLADKPRQVMIESRLLQTDEHFGRELGVDWPGINGCQMTGDVQPRSLGPRPSFTEQVEQGISGKLMGGLLGGGIAGGIGGGSSMGDTGDSGTFLSPNPFENAPTVEFPFGDGTRLGLQFGPSLYQPPAETDPDEDFAVTAPTGPAIPGVRIGIRINPQPVEQQDYAFADAFLVGPDCQRHEPDGRLIYAVVQEVTFSWSIEFWHWRDGALTEHWLKTGSQQWDELLGTGSLPLWVGVRFDGLTPQQLAAGGWSLVTAWTHEQDGQVILTPRVFDLLPRDATVVRDGHTVKLDGLAAGSREGAGGKVPMLGDIPYVGRLFSARGEQTPERDLMMLVTPRLIEPVD